MTTLSVTAQPWWSGQKSVGLLFELVHGEVHTARHSTLLLSLVQASLPHTLRDHQCCVVFCVIAAHLVPAASWDKLCRATVDAK